MEGFNYVGMGNSTNKKDAQSNAARDFINFLVRVNEMKKEEVPAFGVSSSFSLLLCGLCCPVLGCVSSLEFRLNVRALLHCWKVGAHTEYHGII